MPESLAGPEAIAELAAWPCDVVLNGVTGAVGLAPRWPRWTPGRVLALANKESLIVGGPLVADRAAPGQIVPVDSEHSALAQCLRGGRAERCAGWWSPPAAARSCTAAGTSWPRSPRRRRWPTRPGTWAR